MNRFLAMVIVVSVLPLRAQEPPKREETIVVTATRSERKAEEAPVSTTVIEADELLEVAADSVRDAIASAPGVAVYASDVRTHFPTRNQVSMRGLGEATTLVLLDGIPINDPYQGSVHWNKVPIESVDRIEIARGAGASLYGNYALGGTIHILTRPVDSSMARVRASYGSFGTSQVSVAADHLLTDAVSLSAAYDRFDSNGYVRPIEEVRGPIDIPNFSESENFGFRTGWTISDSTVVRGRLNYFDSRTSQGTPTSFNDWTILDLSATGIHVRGENELSFSLFGQDQSFDFQNVRLDAARTRETPANASETDVDSRGGSIQWMRGLSERGIQLTAGLDLMSASATEDRDNFGNGGVVTSVQDVGGRKDLAGLFAQAAWFPRPRLELIVSGRVDYWKNSGGFETKTPGEHIAYDEHTSTQLDPRISARYELAPGLALRGSIYRAFRAPELRELYRSGGSRGTVQLANPFLGPEILLGGEAGVVRSASRWSGEATLFWSDVKDRVTPVTLQSAPTIILEPRNIGRTRSRGLELIGRMPVNRFWSLEGSYTFTDASVIENAADPLLVGKRIPGVPRHAASSSLRFQSGTSFSASLRGRWRTEQYEDAQNDVPYDSHTVFDLGATWAVTPATDLFLVAENLFDEEYLGEVAVDLRRGAPRQIHAGVRVRMPFGQGSGH